MPDAGYATHIETSTVQLTASTLRVHLAATAPTDGLLAVKVAPFFKSKRLPFQLRGFGAHESSLREEFEDGRCERYSGRARSMARPTPD